MPGQLQAPCAREDPARLWSRLQAAAAATQTAAEHRAGLRRRAGQRRGRLTGRKSSSERGAGTHRGAAPSPQHGGRQLWSYVSLWSEPGRGFGWAAGRSLVSGAAGVARFRGPGPAAWGPGGLLQAARAGAQARAQAAPGPGGRTSLPSPLCPPGSAALSSSVLGLGRSSWRGAPQSPIHRASLRLAEEGTAQGGDLGVNGSFGGLGGHWRSVVLKKDVLI